jgi:3'-phosphoadenosine 5'-phosphosulfate sulfotransferase (PAPS reductase)/FAD synthetase
MKQLTVLSFGGGQDSTAILLKIIHDKNFRSKYAPGDLIVIMADTKNEHPETYEHVARCIELCKIADIPFFFLKDGKYTSPCWSDGLIAFYEQKKAVGSKAFPKTCTDKLKITPIYNFLEEYVHTTYQTDKVGRKMAIKEFAEKYGKINVIIGIAAGEEKRMAPNGEGPSVWMNTCITKHYPLVEIGWDRQACQDYIAQYMEVPPPSNCILCPFMSLQELLYLYRHFPQWYNKWVDLEQAKIQNNLHVGDKNLGVWGKKLLPEVLEEAIKKFGHMTTEELREYKMSHGHCVASKY